MGVQLPPPAPRAAVGPSRAGRRNCYRSYTLPVPRAPERAAAPGPRGSDTRIRPATAPSGPSTSSGLASSRVTRLRPGATSGRRKIRVAVDEGVDPPVPLEDGGDDHGPVEPDPTHVSPPCPGTIG